MTFMVRLDILGRAYHPNSQKNSISGRRDNMSKALSSKRARCVPRTEKKANCVRDQRARRMNGAR